MSIIENIPVNRKDILEKFLNIPIDNTSELFNIFSQLPGAICHVDRTKKGFVYIPGTRKDRVVLIAHADTVWDECYTGSPAHAQKLYFENGYYKNQNSTTGIGADDRAGCAMLYLLKDSGHSLLITDGEEHGQIGAHYIEDQYPDIFTELNDHCYMIQLDRRNSRDVKFYSLPVTDEFTSFIFDRTGYVDAGKNSRTDIVALCKKICGVNFSIGYYNEHSAEEILLYTEWENSFNTIAALIEPKQRKFPLKNI